MRTTHCNWLVAYVVYSSVNRTDHLSIIVQLPSETGRRRSSASCFMVNGAGYLSRSQPNDSSVRSEGRCSGTVFKVDVRGTKRVLREEAPLVSPPKENKLVPVLSSHLQVKEELFKILVYTVTATYFYLKPQKIPQTPCINSQRANRSTKPTT